MTGNMENTKSLIKFLCSLLVFVMICNSYVLYAHESSMYQEDEQLSSRMSLSCVQLGEERIQLAVKLRFREDRQYFNIPNAEIIFSGLSDEGMIELGKAVTDGSGEALFLVPDVLMLTRDEDSLYLVSASFEGLDNYGSSEDEVQFKRAKISLSAEVIDSTYQLTISTFQLDGLNTPIGDQDIYVMVPRMFSNLTIANDYSDEDGNLTVIVPPDIPANSDGSLEIIVRIPDTDEFGTLESRIVTDWGIVQEPTEMASRELWSPDAPIWMLVTFVLLMSIVWGHYAVIIYKLYLVRVEGNQINKKKLT